MFCFVVSQELTLKEKWEAFQGQWPWRLGSTTQIPRRRTIKAEENLQEIDELCFKPFAVQWTNRMPMPSWEAAVHLATGGWGWKSPVKGGIHSGYSGGGYWKTWPQQCCHASGFLLGIVLQKGQPILDLFLGSNAAGLSIIWTLSWLHKGKRWLGKVYIVAPGTERAENFYFFFKLTLECIPFCSHKALSFIIMSISAQYFNASHLSEHIYLDCEATGCLVDQEKAICANMVTLFWSLHSTVVKRWMSKHDWQWTE